MAGIPKGKAALETLHINEKKWSNGQQKISPTPQKAPLPKQ
jgi:hypothetical protein